MVYDDDLMNDTVDSFSDGDLAEPKNMPEGKRFVGKVTDVVTEEAEVGNYRQFDKPLKDGRTAVPIITLKVRAFKGVDGSDFDPDANIVQSTTSDYWIGKEDRVGRHSLASLISRATKMPAEEMKAMRVTDAARQLIGATITFEVRHRQSNNGGTFQSATKIRVASDEEAALIA